MYDARRHGLTDALSRKTQPKPRRTSYGAVGAPVRCPRNASRKMHHLSLIFQQSRSRPAGRAGQHPRPVHLKRVLRARKRCRVGTRCAARQQRAQLPLEQDRELVPALTPRLNASHRRWAGHIESRAVEADRTTQWQASWPVSKRHTSARLRRTASAPEPASERAGIQARRGAQRWPRAFANLERNCWAKPACSSLSPATSRTTMMLTESISPGLC